jgi:hypothetical protein
MWSLGTAISWKLGLDLCQRNLFFQNDNSNSLVYYICCLMTKNWSLWWQWCSHVLQIWALHLVCMRYLDKGSWQCKVVPRTLLLISKYQMTTNSPGYNVGGTLCGRTNSPHNYWLLLFKSCFVLWYCRSSIFLNLISWIAFFCFCFFCFFVFFIKSAISEYCN